MDKKRIKAVLLTKALSLFPLPMKLALLRGPSWTSTNHLAGICVETYNNPIHSEALTKREIGNHPSFTYVCI